MIKNESIFHRKIGAAAVLLLFLSPAARAVDSLSLDVGMITAQDWELEGVRIVLGGLNDDSLNFGLSVDKMVLPDPFDHVTFVNIHCTSFVYEPDVIACKRGIAEIKSEWLQPSKILFTFQLGKKNSRLTIDQLKIAGGAVSVNAVQNNDIWKLDINGDHLQAKQLSKFYKLDAIDLSEGGINIRVKGTGSEYQLSHLKFNLALNGMTGQTSNGKYASEALNADIELDAIRKQKVWQWESHLALKSGAIYAEPVFVEADAEPQPIEIKLTGNREEKQGRISLNTASLVHPGVGSLQGHGQLYTAESGLLEKANLSLKTENLDTLSSIYLEPFFAASAMEGVTLAGKLNAEAEWDHQSLSKMNAVFSELGVTDAESRFNLQGGGGTFNWSDQIESNSQSEIRWGKLEIYDLPIGGTDLSLTTDSRSIRLNRQARLPFLDGNITIHRFDWQGRQGEEPRVHFQGDIQQVSLEQFTAALDWTPMSGTVTGHIPGVTYQDGELRLDGELKIRMFDGEVRIKKLVSSALFGDLPRLYGEVEIDHLDLNLITQKFEFGRIQGRLSGYIRNLYLENWEPVTFYAWLGTPEDDDSRHRISQKAVENIASIGGGGAADLVSRSFLRFFDTFGYDKLGIGCYLHSGVCQLMGMEAAPQGYYIVKGGGLPRIDVVGYNSRVDWNVLLKRLNRISLSDNALVD